MLMKEKPKVNIVVKIWIQIIFGKFQIFEVG
jgi:hypothetical protein